MESLLELDQRLFILINQLPHTALLDSIALFLSGVGTAGIIWFVIGFIFFLKEERIDHWFFLPLIIATCTSYIVTEILLKTFFGRFRPDITVSAIIVGSENIGYAFPSGHATFAFAMATVLSKFLPKQRYYFLVLAGAIALSRIYLGKHYPFDILAGGVLGTGIGFVAIWVGEYIRSQRLEPRTLKRKK